jgi:anti-sigma B factor antagonist
MIHAFLREVPAMSVQQRLVVEYNRGKNHDVVVVGFADRKLLDDAEISELTTELFELVEEVMSARVVLNFSNVELMATAVLGMLVRIDRRIKANGGRLKLCHIRPQIHKVFELTRLNTLFDIKPDEHTAISSF